MKMKAKGVYLRLAPGTTLDDPWGRVNFLLVLLGACQISSFRSVGDCIEDSFTPINSSVSSLRLLYVDTPRQDRTGRDSRQLGHLNSR